MANFKTKYTKDIFYLGALCENYLNHDSFIHSIQMKCRENILKLMLILLITIVFRTKLK